MDDLNQIPSTIPPENLYPSPAQPNARRNALNWFKHLSANQKMSLGALALIVLAIPAGVAATLHEVRSRSKAYLPATPPITPPVSAPSMYINTESLPVVIKGKPYVVRINGSADIPVFPAFKITASVVGLSMTNCDFNNQSGNKVSVFNCDLTASASATAQFPSASPLKLQLLDMSGMESLSPVSKMYTLITSTSVPSPTPPNQACRVDGCSGELCLPYTQKQIMSPCRYKPEYQCYKLPSSRCEIQSNGLCGWTKTPELVSCLSKYSSTPAPTPKSTPKPTPKPTTTPRPTIIPSPTPILKRANTPPIFSRNVLPIAVVGRSYTTAISGYDKDVTDSLTLSITGLPSGLTQSCRSTKNTLTNSITCTLSGKVTKAGSYPIQVTLSDNKGATVQQTLTITAQPWYRSIPIPFLKYNQ